jgi:O-antigen/teichoic acid export membrane protein
MPTTRLRDLVSTSPLRAGFLDLLSASFAIQFLGFGTLVLIPRFVSPEELGALKVIQSFVSLFAIFAGLGFNTAVLKLCSEPRPEPERQSILNEALRRTVVSSVVSVLLVALMARTGVLGTNNYLQLWISIYALVIPFEAITNVFASYLQARQRIKELARAQLLVKAQAVVVIVIATWKFGFEGFVYSTIAGYAAGLVPFIRRIGADAIRAPRLKLPRLFWSIAAYSSFANGVNTIGRHADIYVLGLFYQNPTDLGFYALAKIFLSGANVITSTAQRIALPQFSQRSDKEGPFRKLVRTSQFQTAVLSIVVAVAIHFAAALIIHFAYRADYSLAMRYLDILLIKFVIWSTFSILGVATIAMGRPAFNFAGACITTPITVALTYYFLAANGTIGVAWAQVAGAFVSLVVVYGSYSLATRKHFADADERGPLA